VGVRMHMLTNQLIGEVTVFSKLGIGGHILPPALSGMRALVTLDLSSNQFSGAMPSCESCASLQVRLTIRLTATVARLIAQLWMARLADLVTGLLLTAAAPPHLRCRHWTSQAINSLVRFAT
jgi:hypothetical protein